MFQQVSTTETTVLTTETILKPKVTNPPVRQTTIWKGKVAEPLFSTVEPIWDTTSVLRTIKGLLHDTEDALQSLERKVFELTRINTILILKLDGAYRKINYMLPTCDKEMEFQSSTHQSKTVSQATQDKHQRNRRNVDKEENKGSVVEVLSKNLKSVSEMLKFVEDSMKEQRQKFNIYADEDEAFH